MFGFYVFKFSMYALVFGSMGICGYFNDKLLETAFLFGCYIMLRFLTPKTFHSNNFYRCIFWSIVMFNLAIPMTLPLSISLFASVVMGYVISLVLYYIQDYIDLKIEDKKRKMFNIKTSTEDELIARCISKCFNQQDIEQCVIIFKSGLKGDALYKKLCYCERQVKNLRKKYKKLLTE